MSGNNSNPSRSPPPYAISNLAFQLASLLNLDAKIDFIIGIDFGTTFTGVAFAEAVSRDAVKANAKGIAEGIKVFTSWPNPTQNNAEKIPSILAYAKDPPIWGGSVRPSHQPQVAHFKLGLQPRMGDHYGPSGGSILNFLDPNWVSPVPGKKPVDFAADYLTAVLKYIKEEGFPRQFGANYLNDLEIAYVITVPAIWKDSAKSLTREAASRAGIPSRRLELIPEPEAAALYCATISNEVDLTDGDRFMVCDAGGGTVDLISYLVVSHDPFQVEECNQGTGAACGAIFLNLNFENLLRKKLGHHSKRLLTDKRLLSAINFFEGSIKRNFNPYDPNCEKEFEVPLTGSESIPEIGLEDGYLMLSKAEVQGIFQPIFDKIYDLILRQINDVRRKSGENLKTILLVGGLGSSVYLYNFLVDMLKTGIDIKQPSGGYSAIMRGAVFHRLGFNFVKERVLRRSYGMSLMRIPFDPKKDPQHLKTDHPSGIPACRGIMKWYAVKDEKIPAGHVVTKSVSLGLTAEEYQSDPLIDLTVLMVCEDDNPPEYDTDSVVPLCLLPADITSLKPFDKAVGMKGVYYSQSYELSMSFGPELEFSLLYEGRVLGSVSAKYA